MRIGPDRHKTNLLKPALARDANRSFQLLTIDNNGNTLANALRFLWLHPDRRSPREPVRRAHDDFLSRYARARNCTLDMKLLHIVVDRLCVPHNLIAIVLQQDRKWCLRLQPAQVDRNRGVVVFDSQKTARVGKHFELLKLAVCFARCGPINRRFKGDDGRVFHVSRSPFLGNAASHETRLRLRPLHQWEVPLPDRQVSNSPHKAAREVHRS
ncbi:MAG: hypothetical protein DDT37_01508 [Firmicutes bacterium]|nr:hypothetical protein [candidate division NPL-UPA2 bacterium]